MDCACYVVLWAASAVYFVKRKPVTTFLIVKCQFISRLQCSMY